LAANISGIDEDSDKVKTALTRTIFLALNKKILEILFTTNKVILAYVDVP